MVNSPRSLLLLGFALGYGTSPSMLSRGQAADPIPQAPAPRLAAPRALLGFPPGRHLYDLKMYITTAEGKRCALKITVDQEDAQSARDHVLLVMTKTGFAVEESGNLNMVIKGVKQMGGSVAAIKSVKLILRGVDNNAISRDHPTLLGVGDVQTEVDK